MTHRKAGKRLARRLIIIDNTNTTHATRVVIKKPEGLVHVLCGYGNGQNSAGGASLGVSEARVKAIDGDVCVVFGDTRAVKSRLGCRVVPTGDCSADQSMTIDTSGAYS